MLENIYGTGGLVFSQRFLLALTASTGSREEAYKLVQENAFEAHRKKESFMDSVKADSRVTKHMAGAEIEECFTLDYYLKHVDTIFGRVFK
jgi:adenylosuccinate lyase